MENKRHTAKDGCEICRPNCACEGKLTDPIVIHTEKNCSVEPEKSVGFWSKPTNSSVEDWKKWIYEQTPGEFVGDIFIEKFEKLLAKERLLAQEEALDIIAKGEGWEESRDHYAKILGINL